MIKLVFKEGLGSYSGIPVDWNYHPLGRMGASLKAYKDGVKVFETTNASTLPDSIEEGYANKFNDGMTIPVVREGIYSLYADYHKGQEAFRLQRPTLVLRKDEKSESNGIDVHSRPVDDPSSYASSTGCITVLEMEELLEALDIDAYEGQFVGQIVIDRSNLAKYVYNNYRTLYPNNIDLFASRKYDNDLQYLVDNFIVSSPEYWQDLIDTNSKMNIVSVKTFITMIRNVVEKD